MGLGKLMRHIHRVHKAELGLTAIELAVVVALLAILASLVAGNVTGMSTSARSSSMATDISEMQKAVDNFVGQHPLSAYPTAGGTISGTTSIVFTATLTADDITKVFVPDFFQRNPKHASDGWWKLTSGGTVTVIVPAGSAY